MRLLYRNFVRPDERPNDSNLGRSLWQGFQSPLGRRFVFLTVLCSSVIALVMTLIQLGADYYSERTDLDQTVEKLEQTFLPSLTKSVWAIDEILIQSQLDGIVRLTGVQFSEIIFEDGGRTTRGDPSAPFSRAYEFPLIHNSGDRSTALGTLFVRVSYTAIQIRVLRRGVVLLATNALKAAIVAAFILLIYHRLIGRHLSELAWQAPRFDVKSKMQPIVLNREPQSLNVVDELTLLAEAMNAERKVIHSSVEQLHAINREQAKFTYAISHDLKSPANTVELLLRELRHTQTGRFDDLGEELLDDMEMTLTRMSELIADVMAYSRSVQAEIDFAKVDLRQEVEQVLTSLSEEISEAEAEVRLGALPPVVGNAAQLRLLMQHLISNAVKFRDPVRPLVLEIDGSKTAGSSWTSISVKDNGIGIDDKDLESIFDLFRRLHTYMTYQGSGLGLAICRRVVSNHGGKVEVASRKGEGTTFTVLLPDHQPDKAPQP